MMFIKVVHLFVMFKIIFHNTMSLAACLPKGSIFDNRIQYVDYNPSDIVEIKALKDLGLREIRDIHGAKACIDAAMTGHNVWTTLHTKDPIFALTRLCNMGIDMDLVTDSSLVIGLIGQRLARKLCCNCKLPYASGLDRVATEERLLIEETCELNNLYLHNPKGCQCCRYSGFSGRTTIAEVIATDADFMYSFVQGGAKQAREHWFLNGGITKNQHMVARINQGILDPIYASHDICPLDQDKIIFGSQSKQNPIGKSPTINLDLITG